MSSQPVLPARGTARCDECSAPEPPTGNFLDRLVEHFERDGHPSRTSEMIPLARVLEAAEVARLPQAIVDFYTDPTRYGVWADLTANRWSRFLLQVFSVTSRQCLPLAGGQNLVSSPVCQWLYTDGQGRVHWDRYACIAERCQRLFVARMGFCRGYIRETFIVFGIPIALTFQARISASGLTLESTPRLLSPLSWISRVVYRTEVAGSGLVTRGDFRVPWLGMHAQTEFRMESPRNS